MTDNLTILGLESSCDDTAAAVVRMREHGAEILSSVVLGQDDLHGSFGGIVPEIAARAHAEKLDIAVNEALNHAETSLDRIQLVAATAGPGLIGGVLSGVMTGKAIAAARGLPLVGVNHLAGHALTPRLTDGLAYPYVMLLVSGGHCQFLLVEGSDRFTRLGGTIDDAPGEAFDKSARLLGLSQPGGPMIEREARGRCGAVPFPAAPAGQARLRHVVFRVENRAAARPGQVIAEKGGLTRRDRADLCAGFQGAVADVLQEKTRRALTEAGRTFPCRRRWPLPVAWPRTSSFAVG